MTHATSATAKTTIWYGMSERSGIGAPPSGLWRLGLAGAETAAHLRGGLHVLHVLFVQAAKAPPAQRGHERRRHLGLDQHDLLAVLEDLGLHPLLAGHGEGAPLLRLRLRDALVGLGLLGLKPLTD